MTDLAQHVCQSYFAIWQSRWKSGLGSGYESRLTSLWQSHSFCWHIIEIGAHLRSATHRSGSQRVGYWVKDRVFMATEAFGAGYRVAKDWISSTSQICNSVQNDVFGIVWSQLWQAATHYGCIIPAQGRLRSDKFATKVHVPVVQSVHPTRPRLVYESVLDWYVQATTTMDWTFHSASTVHWRMVALHNYTINVQTWPLSNLT